MTTGPRCKTCNTPLAPLENKNRGYYVGCPNKAKHAEGYRFIDPDDATPAAQLAVIAASPAAAPPSKTLFGW